MRVAGVEGKSKTLADGSPGGRGHSGLTLRAEVRKPETQCSAESLQAGHLSGRKMQLVQQKRACLCQGDLTYPRDICWVPVTCQMLSPSLGETGSMSLI